MAEFEASMSRTNGPRENAFRKGACHAAGRLASALALTSSLQEARELTNAFAEAIEQQRDDQNADFILERLMREARDAIATSSADVSA